MAKPFSPIQLDSAVRKLQLSLLDGCHDIQLAVAGLLISKHDYLDVVKERSIANLCGSPICPNPLPPPSDHPRKGRNHIPKKQIEETLMYCSNNCYISSRNSAFAYFGDERCSPNRIRVDKVLGLFEELGREVERILEVGGELKERKDELWRKFEVGFRELRVKVEDEDSVGTGRKNVEVVGLGDLKIRENVDGKGVVMPIEEWVGPSDAIEGYVPQRERGSKDKDVMPSVQGPKRETKSTRPKEGKTKAIDEMDFTSSIIIGDQFTAPKGLSDPNLKQCGTDIEKSRGHQLNISEASTPSVQKVSEVMELKRELSTVALESQLGIPELLYGLSETVSTGGVKDSREEISRKGMTVSNGTTLNSTVSPFGAKKTSKRNTTSADGRKIGKTKNGDPSIERVNDEITSTEVQRNSDTDLKSSLKCSGPKNLRRNVTWADKRKTGNAKVRNLCEVQQVSDIAESVERRSNSNMEVDNGSHCLASAEACLLALSQAAEAVASGVSDITDAVSEAGITILPQAHKDSQSEEEVVEQELAPLKWPKKPGDPFDADFFEAEDSWYEPPPEGFSLTLSAFSTMWSALFEWITSSSLAYIYGRDGNSHEEFLSVNGREYPCKVVSSEGRSSQIKQTLAGCLGRALPEVATNLRLKTSISTLEKGLDNLLNTMSFMEALPPFKLKQWHVILLLFLDALSVCRIPGLASQMTTGRKLLHKVLDGAQVSVEEYEFMKDLLIPLGSVPQFSAHSGG